MLAKRRDGMSLEGKVASVTGAGSGIGRATAVLFSQMGAKVVLVGRKSDPLKNTLSEFHGGHGIGMPYPVYGAREWDVRGWERDLA